MLTAILFALLDGAAAPPPPSAPTTGQYASPGSLGGPHVCAESQYPVSALQTATEGRTILKFTITAEGRVRDVSVNTSSGNADLDAASVTCARDWLYRPAKQNGVPVDAPWLAQVRWQIGVEQPYSAVIGAAKNCLKDDPVSWDEMKKAPYRPVVRVHFAGGVMTDIALAGSTGDPDLDGRTLACYRSLPPEQTANVPDGDELFVIMKPND